MYAPGEQQNAGLAEKRVLARLANQAGQLQTVRNVSQHNQLATIMVN